MASALRAVSRVVRGNFSPTGRCAASPVASGLLRVSRVSWCACFQPQLWCTHSTSAPASPGGKQRGRTMASFVRASQRLVVTYQKSDGLPSPPSSKKSSAQPAALATTPAATVFPTQARIVSTPVAPPQVIHTSAYLQQTQQLVLPPVPVSSFEDDNLLQKQQEDISSNALVWALQKVDDQLNQVEQQPSDVHRALYEFSNGPVGQATSKGVQAAAKITMTATIEAAKAAAPVGKWALQQGVKAAVGLVGAAMAQEQQRNKQQKQPGGTKQQNSKSRW